MVDVSLQCSQSRVRYYAPLKLDISPGIFIVPPITALGRDLCNTLYSVFEKLSYFQHFNGSHRHRYFENSSKMGRTKTLTFFFEVWLVLQPLACHHQVSYGNEMQIVVGWGWLDFGTNNGDRAAYALHAAKVWLATRGQPRHKARQELAACDSLMK